MNYARTALLMAAMTGLFLALGWAIGGQQGMALALVVAFCAGALSGVLAMTGYVIGLRRDAARARAESAALRLEHDALRAERETPGIEPDAAAGATAAASMPATERQVPHGL